MTTTWLPMSEAPRERIVAWAKERSEWRVVVPNGADRAWDSLEQCWLYAWTDVETGAVNLDDEFTHWLRIEPPN